MLTLVGADWAILRDFNCSTRIPVCSVVKVLTLHPPSSSTKPIERLLSSQPGPIVVAIDGGSGAGKSALASLNEKEIDAVLIHLDDFFSAEIPDEQQVCPIRLIKKDTEFHSTRIGYRSASDAVNVWPFAHRNRSS